MQPKEQNEKRDKSTHALREERVLAFWKEKGIFEKSLEKNKKKGKKFVFFEGPPTANGKPGIHHLEARAFKDAIPRYKTMNGYYVRRKGGWDTHGLPVELQVEKELGLKSKKEIETYGIGPFNEKCKESVWKYVHEWEDFTERMGYWIDLKDPYITYKPEYIESLWNIVKKVDKDGLLYKDYKVVPWCPRCGTGLSSHELAQGYKDVKDLAVTVQFKIKDQRSKIKNSNQELKAENSYFLAWTTTPWTLPGNVALAVGEKIDYVEVKIEGEDNATFIIAKDRLSILKDKKYSIEKTFKGKDLVGSEYEPLYPFLKDNISGSEKEKLGNAFKVYKADFVNTEDGTGIVHTAVMYGQDDFELGTKVGLPKYHLVNEDGTFKDEAGFLAGKFVKDESTDVDIIKDLAGRGLLFDKGKHEHSYPFCWRCHTALIYFARDSWYIRMSDLRNKLVKENESINWEPKHIRDGRFGEWLREVKDWAISRERYWGTPLPIWICEKCGERKVIGSVEEIKQKSKNNYFVMRHGEAENNTLGILSSDPKVAHNLTEIGRKQVEESAKSIKNLQIDLIITSPFVRTLETSEIVRKIIGLSNDQVVIDNRAHELDTGIWNGKKITEYTEKFIHHEDRFVSRLEGGETYLDVKKRMGDLLYDTDGKYIDQNILIITHELPSLLLISAARGLDRVSSITLRGSGEFINNAEIKKVDFSILPHNTEYELDLHRPHIDNVTLNCKCGGSMKRIKEVMDVWFDSGAMPFAQDHYPFEGKKLFAKMSNYPADYISEAIDQTRGWFYTLHAIGTLMSNGKAYKNVICLGHILDKEGKKMSKSIGNVVNPQIMMDKYGADALRFWMYSINQPGDSKNFDEKTVDEVVKKVFNLATNVTAFYKMYDTNKIKNESQKVLASKNILDMWIVARMNQLIEITTKGLDNYSFFEPTRAIRDFIADLSQWYVRRSRDRFKEDGEDKDNALETTKYILITLAKVMAPFAPFFAEWLYGEVGGEKESVHLEEWPKKGKIDRQLIVQMALARDISSKGLEARMGVKINVRQPLASLKIKNNKKFDVNCDKGLANLIKDEVNVKEVLFDKSIVGEVEIDTNITPELKEEGDLRELMRKIQDMRKEKGLSIGNMAKLTIPIDMKILVYKYIDELKKATGLTSITVGDSLRLEV